MRIERLVRCSTPTRRKSKRSVDQRLRTLLDFLAGHHFLLRGQLRRSAEFADMFLMEFPKEGPQPCYCWIFMIDNGKTNDTGKRQYLGAMRHKDILFYSQGVLAQYRYHRFHVAAGHLGRFCHWKS